MKRPERNELMASFFLEFETSIAWFFAIVTKVRPEKKWNYCSILDFFHEFESTKKINLLHDFWLFSPI